MTHTFKPQKQKSNSRAYDGIWTYVDLRPHIIPDRLTEYTQRLREDHGIDTMDEDTDLETIDRDDLDQEAEDLIDDILKMREDLADKDTEEVAREADAPRVRWRCPTGSEALRLKKLRTRYFKAIRQHRKEVEAERGDEIEAEVEDFDDDVELTKEDLLDHAVQSSFTPPEKLRTQVIDWLTDVIVGVDDVVIEVDGREEQMRWDDDSWLRDMTQADPDEVRRQFISSFGDDVEQMISTPFDMALTIYAEANLSDDKKKT
jgi:hypothetical protein